MIFEHDWWQRLRIHTGIKSTQHHWQARAQRAAGRKRRKKNAGFFVLNFVGSGI